MCAARTQSCSLWASIKVGRWTEGSVLCSSALSMHMLGREAPIPLLTAGPHWESKSPETSQIYLLHSAYEKSGATRRPSPAGVTRRRDTEQFLREHSGSCERWEDASGATLWQIGRNAGLGEAVLVSQDGAIPPRDHLGLQGPPVTQPLSPLVSPPH